MEFVRGPTLSRRLQEDGPLPPARAAAIVERLAWALEAAHQAGVIHRDIKPSNVILTPDLETGEEPKLIDFGLAKLAGSVAESLTRAGQIVGTPDYMSPEQIANRAVDARSDVYSLGCLLYESLAGRPPFDAEEDLQVLYQQLQRPAEPVERYAPETPTALGAVVERALAKNPSARFQSMREMAVALGAARLQITGAPPPPRDRHERRHSTLVAAAGALLALAVGLGVGKMVAPRARPPAPSAASTSGGITVTSRPPGAQVEIDGRALARPTPAVAIDLGPGAHRVRVGKDGLAPVERMVTIAAGEHAVVDVSLASGRRTVQVRSTPTGASVFLDGQLALGQTPTNVEVVDDDFHELRVELTGYRPVRRRLTPDDHDPVLSVPLEPETRPRSSLVVDSNGAAEVWVDGVDTGVTTPTLPLEVPAGAHAVEVRDGATRARAKIKVAPGETLRLLLTPGHGGRTEAP
jgi:hypothetical protein